VVVVEVEVEVAEVAEVAGSIRIVGRRATSSA
jgi:hypothetical protein